LPDSVQVFVSHSYKDDAFTARLVADLRAAGADVWVDSTEIAYDDFVKRINEGLAHRDWLVLVLTPSALGSRWVQAEVNAALNLVHTGRMRGVIPLLAHRCNEAEIPPLWATLHRYDATTGYAKAISGLLRALRLPYQKKDDHASAEATNVKEPGEATEQRARPAKRASNNANHSVPPKLHFWPLRFDFGMLDIGRASPVREAEIGNRGGGQLFGRIETNMPSLLVEPASIDPTTTHLSIKLDTTGLLIGTHVGHIATRTNGGDLIVPVRFVVVARGGAVT